MDEAEQTTPLRSQDTPAMLNPPAEAGVSRRSGVRCPPGHLFHAILGVIVVWLLWSVSVPGDDLIGFVVGVYALAAMGVVWFIQGAMFLYRRDDPPTVSERPFVVAPVVVTLTLAPTLLDVPFEARWAISRPAFERMAEQMAVPASVSDPEPQPSSDDQRLGLYRINEIEEIGDGIIFTEEHGSGAFGDAGFAYLPSGPSSADEYGELELEELGGDWYRWTASW